MADRRTFIKTLAATLAASRSVLGANDRVQMGIIGTGMRGNQVYQSFMRNKDVVFVTACDVRKSRLDKFVADSGTKMTAVGDYRRVLDNKDVDAVLLTVPDHWHSPMVIQALQAGKDIYCEKPVSNTLEAAIKMRDACRASKQIVQVGCQQRSWQHFQDQAKRIKEGYIGKINHCVLLFTGFGAFAPAQEEKPEAPPADLDWEMFQGPAPHHPYVPGRLNWRAYWDYGGGSITDWGVHLTDVMLWYMNSDSKGPQLTSASYMYTSGYEDPEKAPDTFSEVRRLRRNFQQRHAARLSWLDDVRHVWQLVLRAEGGGAREPLWFRGEAGRTDDDGPARRSWCAGPGAPATPSG
jgi:predicted dehydrogenase